MAKYKIYDASGKYWKTMNMSASDVAHLRKTSKATAVKTENKHRKKTRSSGLGFNMKF